jgi:hypothetical protein
MFGLKQAQKVDHEISLLLELESKSKLQKIIIIIFLEVL